MSTDHKSLIPLISSEKEWLETLSRPSLLVLDVHSKWAGPCEALTNTFKKMLYENNEKVQFVQVMADNIPELVNYRDSSLPQFLVYIRNLRLAHIKGANAPLISKVIKEKLEIEAKGLDQTAITDSSPLIKKSPQEKNTTLNGSGSLRSDQENRQDTLVIIKPDAMAPSTVEAIIDSIKAHRFEIVNQKMIWLTMQQAEEFYADHKDKPFYEGLCSFLSSSPIMALHLSKENAVLSFRAGAGPTNPSRAREEVPRSIRALYGTDNTMNAVYSADSVETAKQNIEFIFGPKSTIQTCTEVRKDKVSIIAQKSVMIIKPNTSAQVVDEIIKKLLWHRFEILKREEVVLSSDQAKQIYAAHQEADYFSDMIDYVTSGPVVCMVIRGENAINDLNLLIGDRDPVEARKTLFMSFRALYGEDSIKNAVDCSSSLQEASAQIRILFPGNADSISRQVSTNDLQMRSRPSSTNASRRGSVIRPISNIIYPDAIIAKSSRALYVFNAEDDKDAVESSSVKDVDVGHPPQLTLALIKPDAFSKKEQIIERIKENGFKIVAEKEIQLSKETAGEFYKEHSEKPFYPTLVEFMSSSPLYAMALEKRDGIASWRELAGPTNSESARKSAPQSIRAIFGTDGTQNAVHGSDSKVSAAREIDLFFNERTLALIKPDAYSAGKKEEIITRLVKEGFKVLLEKECKVDSEVAKELCKEHETTAFYEKLVSWMSGGPFYAIILEKGLAISALKTLIGPNDPEKAKIEAPNSMRALYGTNVAFNAVHASADAAVAEKEISLLFTQMELNPPTVLSQEEKISAKNGSRGDLSGKFGSKSNLTGRLGSKGDLSGRLGSKGDLSNRMGSRGELSNKLGSASRLGSTSGLAPKKVGSTTDLSANKLGSTTKLASKSEVGAPKLGSIKELSSNKLVGSTKDLTSVKLSDLEKKAESNDKLALKSKVAPTLGSKNELAAPGNTPTLSRSKLNPKSMGSKNEIGKTTSLGGSKAILTTKGNAEASSKQSLAQPAKEVVAEPKADNV